MNYIPLYSPCLGPALLALRGTLQPQRLLHENPSFPIEAEPRARVSGAVLPLLFTPARARPTSDAVPSSIRDRRGGRPCRRP